LAHLPIYRFAPRGDTISRMNTNGATPAGTDGLAAKIARLVEERGWNQEDFARITKLNRQTVRQILLNQGRRPHNATVQACAKALGLTVSELRTLPLDRLLARLHGQAPSDDEENLRRLFERARLPDLRAWLERNPDRAARLTSAELDELFELQDNGTLANFGVERCVELIERRRRLIGQVQAIARTEYLDFLERFVAILHEKVRPAGE
jgi:transcriptional regulator with XRE-family HTH domain